MKRGSKIVGMERLKRVLSYFKPYLRWLTVGAFCMILFGQTDALLALFVRPMFDKIFVERNADFLLLIPLFGIGLMIFKNFFGFLYGYFLGYVNTRVTIAIRNDLYERFLHASLSYFDANPSGEMLAKLQVDAFNMQNSINILMGMFQQSITFLALIAVVFYRDWMMALLGLCLAPLVGIPVAYMGRVVRLLTNKALQSMEKLNVHMLDTLSAMRIVKAFGLEKRRAEGFEKVNEEFFKLNMKAVATNLMTHPVIETIITLGVSAVLLYGGHMVIAGKMTPGVLFSFLTALGLIYDPIRNLSKANNQLQASLASADRIFETLDSIPTMPERPDAKPLPPFSDKIVFQNVSFNYYFDKEKQIKKVLRNINIEVKKGQVLAIVGSSGAGKTTFVNMIPRFYDVTEGAIKIDGIDIRDVTLKSLREQISVVTQETFLFNDTIKNNIAYGVKRKVSDADIEAVAKAAYAHDFITALPEGYDTFVGERGVRLSGGERQRIAIARALLKDSPILILDEATSSLDTEAEMMVQRAIDNLMENRTVFVIAHRLSTVRGADLIIVLEEGCILEKGTHEELLQKSGIYKKLYELQFAEADRKLLKKKTVHYI